MKKIFFAAMALALVGCTHDNTIGHGDIYIVGHQGKVCTGTLEMHSNIVPLQHQPLLRVVCDNGIIIADVKNISIRSDSSHTDASKYEEVFDK